MKSHHYIRNIINSTAGVLSVVALPLMLCAPVLAQQQAAKPAQQAVAKATVQGRVESDGKTPLTDWMLVIQRQPVASLPVNQSRKPVGTRLLADGTFAFVNVEPGQQYLCLYIDGRLDSDSIVRMNLEGGEKRTDVIVKPKQPRAQFRVALQQSAGKALGRKVKVHLFNAYGAVDAATKGTWSDQNGVVSFGRLPAGRYGLWIDSANSTTNKVQQTRPAANAKTTSVDLPSSIFNDLEVTSGTEPQQMDLVVPPPGAAQGKLMLADGKTPARGYVVAVRSAIIPAASEDAETRRVNYARGARDCYAETTVQADGSFAINGLTKGIHALDIRRPGERNAWFTIPVVPAFSGEAISIGTWNIPQTGWQQMFDGQTLKGWKETNFAGQGQVRIENGHLTLEMGNDMTGVTWAEDLPRVDYEINLEGMRVDGSDFFCGLTFPVQDAPCSLILGGWGGSMVGLSSIDNRDASENETTKVINFDSKRWYRVRLRVTKPKIEAWLDNEKIIDLDLADKKLSIRIEVEESKPLGIATWRTTGAIRDMRIRRLDPATELAK